MRPSGSPARRIALGTATLALAVTIASAADERIHADVNARIREEGLQRSQVMRTAQVLTDVYGPRLTGSPSLTEAARWALRQLEGWGLVNARLEPWAWGHQGWSLESAWGAIVEPVQAPLLFEVLAWTPGTEGTVTARAVHLVPPDRPTEAELTSYLASMGRQVRGGIVLVGAHRRVPVQFASAPRRLDDEQVKALYGGEEGTRPAPEARPAPRSVRPAAPASPAPPVLPASEVSRRIDRFLLEHGARLRINDAGRPHGQIAAFANSSYDVATAVPTVVLRNEDYGRITRLLAGGHTVDLRFDIVTRSHPEGAVAFNAIAEIPGTDLKDEVVMLGAHLDSWHAATGATDNAIGCAVMMEAVRILRAAGVSPRRTIRIALWSGEEQGLLGSQAYVAQHFGTFEEPRPGFDKLTAYLNMDHGTGRVRGATVFGPPAAAQALREIFRPLADLGVAGASATAVRALGGTDHTSFSRAGLPGINVGQDPIEYRSHTHHTNLDTYERLIEEDARASAVVIASTVYHLAMRDDRLPRFSRQEMPRRR